MTIQEFISGLQKELEIESKLESQTNLKELDEWDSMTAMLLIGYVSNEFNITLTSNDLDALTTIDSLIQRIEVKNFK